MSENEIVEIWCEFEEWDEPIDPLDANSDVVLELADGTRWAATFFTLRNVARQMVADAENGKYLGGTYFCAKDCIIVRELTRPVIEATMRDLLAKNDLEFFCQKV